MHPHLGIECEKHSYNKISLDLLDLTFDPQIEVISREITLSTTALRETFLNLLATESIETSEISGAQAIFLFQGDKWPIACVVRATTSDNQTVERRVDSGGRSADIHK